MTINSSISAVSSVNTNNQVTTTSTDASSKKSTDTSFKKEMDKVATKDNKKDVEKKDDSKTTEKKEQSVSVQEDVNKDNSEQKQEANQQSLSGDIAYNVVSAFDSNNIKLSNDIQQMYLNNINQLKSSEISSVDFFNTGNSENKISMTEADAEFFINLTQNNEMNFSGISAQANAMIENGVDVKNVKHASQISQTLLDAIANAKETNQPLRIDFDNDIAVILRINRDGVLGANFIPGDKVVEQYLKDNIASLKATFESKDLEYSELTYSSRGSKQQKENQRQKQQENK